MTRTILILGLIVLAAFLPLAVPVAIFVLAVPLVVLGDAARAVAQARPAAFAALTPARAPPSR